MFFKLTYKGVYMIDSNILKMLISNKNEPSYSTIITDFTQKKFCNKEQLQLTINQVSPNVYNIINNKNEIINQLIETIEENGIDVPSFNDISISNIVSKTLTIDTSLNYNASSEMFNSELFGSVSNETILPLDSQKLTLCIKNNTINFVKKDYPAKFKNANFTLSNKLLTIDVPDDIIEIQSTITHNDIEITIDERNIIIPFGEYTFENEIDLNTIIDDLLTCDAITTLNQQISLNNYTIQVLEDEIANLEDSSMITQKQNQINTLQEENETHTQNKETIENTIKSIGFTQNKPFDIDISYKLKQEISFKAIECITANLASSIKIDFINTYKNIPSVIPTIDKNNKIFSSYETSFEKDINNNYIGVTIEFKNIRKRNSDIELSILIIGDKIDST